MDVRTPPVPAEYERYRQEVRRFIAANRPRSSWPRRSGMRVPDSAEEVEELRAWVRALHDAGHVLERFAPGEVDPVRSRVLEEELTTAGVPYVLGNPLVVGALVRFGTDDQRRRHLPAIARGDHIWTQLFSEPDAGSDLASLRTRAVLDRDHYVLSGQKVWSTWAQWADFGYLLARTDPDAEKHRGITAFILDMRSPGVEVRPLREITGTADFNEVFLHEVRVPVTNVIGRPGQGWEVATYSLADERSSVGAGGDETLRALVATARAHGRMADTAVRQDIARLAARDLIRRCLGYRSATRAASGQQTPWDAPIAKIWFSELNLAAVELGLAIQGPRAVLVEGEPLSYRQGWWQDAFLYARAWTIAGGTNEVLRNLIAERGLGLPR